MNIQGETLLIMACKEEVPCYILEACYKANETHINVRDQNELKSTPLQYVCDKANVECMKVLVSAGANLDDTNEWGETAMIRCARGKDVEKRAEIFECIKYLVGKGADTKIKDKDNQDLATVCLHHGYLEIVDFLKELDEKTNDTQ